MAKGSALERLPLAGKVGIGLLFLALLGVVYFVVFYGDIDSQLTAAKAKEGQLAKDKTKAEESRKAYQADLEEKSRRELALRDQRRLLPDEAETPQFLSALQSLAITSGITLTSWSPMAEAPQEFYVKVPMKLILTGKFHQVVRFFRGISQADRIINVEDIKMQIRGGAAKAAAADTGVTLEVNCLATAFRAPQAADAKAGGKKK